MSFRDDEKTRYEKLKTKLFSSQAQQNGTYRNIPRTFCLADNCSEENIFIDIRQPAIDYFKARDIKWHSGLDHGQKPSNHLCCSQSCCANFLFPMINKPDLIKRVFKLYYPNVEQVLPVKNDLPLSNGQPHYMAFEWIGLKDYLGEQKRKKMPRTRGANFTSADFMFRFKRTDGKTQLILGEWKYTESYSAADMGIEVRKNNYIEWFYRENGHFLFQIMEMYEGLFFDPFYQLMRLQLLAQEMEVEKLEADIASVLHICPEVNKEFRYKITSPYLSDISSKIDVLEIWKELVPSDKFKSISAENLLNTIINIHNTDELKWANYLKLRYGWNKGIDGIC